MPNLGGFGVLCLRGARGGKKKQGLVHPRGKIDHFGVNVNFFRCTGL